MTDQVASRAPNRERTEERARRMKQDFKDSYSESVMIAKRTWGIENLLKEITEKELKDELSKI